MSRVFAHPYPPPGLPDEDVTPTIIVGKLASDLHYGPTVDYLFRLYDSGYIGTKYMGDVMGGLATCVRRRLARDVLVRYGSLSPINYTLYIGEDDIYDVFISIIDGATRDVAVRALIECRPPAYVVDSLFSVVVNMPALWQAEILGSVLEAGYGNRLFLMNVEEAKANYDRELAPIARQVLNGAR